VFNEPGEDERDFDHDERSTSAPLLAREVRESSLDDLDELERTEGLHDGALIKVAKGTLLDGIANVRLISSCIPPLSTVKH